MPPATIFQIHLTLSFDLHKDNSMRMEGWSNAR
jgi:hypothetical protein